MGHLDDERNEMQQRLAQKPSRESVTDPRARVAELEREGKTLKEIGTDANRLLIRERDRLHQAQEALRGLTVAVDRHGWQLGFGLDERDIRLAAALAALAGEDAHETTHTSLDGQ